MASSAEDVAALVAEADALHAQAAAHNKAGEFDLAKATYKAYAAALERADEASFTETVDSASRRLWAAVGAAAQLSPASAAVRRRAVAAVVGAAVADAASMPTHWVYDMAKLRQLLATESDAAFFSQPQSEFYTYAHGRSSPYGEQTAALLQSLAETRGWSAEAYAARTFDAFGPAFRAAGGYLDGSLKGFIRNAVRPALSRAPSRRALTRSQRRGAAVPHTGVEDGQANAVARLPPLVALLAGDERLLPCVAEMVAVTQSDAAARAAALAAARVLEACIVGSAATPLAAVEAVAAQLEEGETKEGFRRVLALRGSSHAEAVSELGRNCHLPGNLWATLHALVACGSYAQAVRDTISQGGCNASRASLVGACFAACEAGEGEGQEDACVPPEWRAKFGRYAELRGMAVAVAALRA